MISFTCECCNFTKEFKDAEEAFNIGWDAPPYFTQYTACNLCPGAFIVLGGISKHKTIHEKWAKEGRPDTFTFESCLREEDRPTPESWKKVETQMNAIFEEIGETTKFPSWSKTNEQEHH